MRVLRALGVLAVTGCVVLGAAVWFSLQDLPERLEVPYDEAARVQVFDRRGQPLSFTFAGEWNHYDQVKLYQVPESLQQAFLEAEDSRFYDHGGVDWWARLGAVWQNIRALRVVRGASTISEQVVRMLHPRRRSIFARVLEGIEAEILESRFSKSEILEFYLNQVPYAARRRGVVQAARYYFDRDLDTLTPREELALAVMVRAPHRLDLYRGGGKGVDARVKLLAQELQESGRLSTGELAEVRASSEFQVARPVVPLRADHFVRYVVSQEEVSGEGRKVRTTLDGALQGRVQSILDDRVRDLGDNNVSDGALLVVDNARGEVLAWVNVGEFGQEKGSQFDAILTPRQPGSTLKPFVYALALSRGWTAATVIDDSPLAQGVGAGLHNFRNYSRVYYGELPVREALGNSLNVPAVKTVQFTGKGEFLSFLRNAGFASLTKSADHYGEGLALGNGEVTLFELVQAYAALAHQGVFRKLRVLPGAMAGYSEERQIVSPEVSSIVSDILADPQARRREFGSGGLLRFPVETAVKTGTSTDYRDAWAIGYSDNFTVGVWLGNLNRQSMKEVSGARGPALVLRSVFAELERNRTTNPLYRSHRLARRTVCSHTGLLAGPSCPRADELFVPGSEPQGECLGGHSQGESVASGTDRAPSVSVTLPTPGLNMARDPRIPDDLEAFPFEISTTVPVQEVRWLVDGDEVARRPGTAPRYLWPLREGHHTVKARILAVGGGEELESNEVGFWVR